MRRLENAAASGRLLDRLRAGLGPGLSRADGALPEVEELARRLGADERAVERALEVLEAEGRIRRGACGVRRLLAEDAVPRAAALDPVGTLIEARLRLEPELSALAALRAERRDICRMNRLSARIMAVTCLEEQVLWNAALHRMIASVAGNAHLLAAFDALEDSRRSDPEWRRVALAAVDLFGLTPLAASDYGAVIDAIAAGDPEVAAEAMRAHLLRIAALMERASASAAERDRDSDRA